MSQIAQYFFRSFARLSRRQMPDRPYSDATSAANLNNVGTCSRRLDAQKKSAQVAVADLERSTTGSGMRTT